MSIFMNAKITSLILKDMIQTWQAKFGTAIYTIIKTLGKRSAARQMLHSNPQLDEHLLLGGEPYHNLVRPRIFNKNHKPYAKHKTKPISGPDRESIRTAKIR